MPPSAPAAPPPTASAPKSSPPPASPPTNSPPPSPPGSAESSSALSDDFAELEAMDKGLAAPARKEPEKPATPKAGTQDAPPEPGKGDKPPEGTGKEDAAEKAGKPSDAEIAEAGKFQKAKPLRLAYEALKKTVEEEYKPQIAQLAQLKQKVQQLEEGNGHVPEQVQQKLEAIEKRNQELERHIAFVDYRESKEYKEKYEQPYQKAWVDAVRELKGLTMEVEDPKTGETARREVTEADLQYFASLDPAARRTEINRLFPEDKEEVKRHINEISRLYETMRVAEKKAKDEAETFVKTKSQEQQATQQQRAQLWKSTNEALTTKYAHLFKPVEGDTEGNALLEKGRALADLIFAPQDLTPEGIEALPKSFGDAIKANRNLTPQQITLLYSIVRNKAMNHDRIASQASKLRKENEELKKTIAEYEKSKPDGIPAAGGVRGKTGTENDLEELQAIERKYS